MTVREKWAWGVLVAAMVVIASFAGNYDFLAFASLVLGTIVVFFITQIPSRSTKSIKSRRVIMNGLSLKEVDYPGFTPASGGRVAYVVVGNQVYFSGLTPPQQSTSTINAAESIIQAICRAADLDWRACEFYDIQTHWGYSQRAAGQWVIDQLHVVCHSSDPNRPYVVSWTPLGRELLPPAVFQLFDPLTTAIQLL